MVGVCSYLLVSFWFTRIAANQSSISAFLANRVGDCFVVIGMFATLWSLGMRKNCKVINKNQKTSSLTTKYTLSYAQGCFHKTTNLLGTQTCTSYFNHISHTQIRKYSNSPFAPYLAGLIEGDSKLNTIDPYFITGFSDAESCFYVGVEKTTKTKVGWRIKCSFEIHLGAPPAKDLVILEKIQTFFGLGSITNSKGSCKYSVQSVKDLSVIIDHFDKFPLITKKHIDFILFKDVLNLVSSSQHLTEEGLHKIIAIKASINKGLSPTLAAAFPDVVPVSRPTVLDFKIKDPNWLSGFTTGDGYFMIRAIKRNNSRYGYNIQLVYNLTQHSRDRELIESLVDYLGCGRAFIYKDAIKFEVTKFADLAEKILPLFQKYPLHGVKLYDYCDFAYTIEMMKNKGHLTEEGLDLIKKIKLNMYKERIYNKNSFPYKALEEEKIQTNVCASATKTIFGSQNKRYYSTLVKNNSESKNMNCYLAGLIEGKGIIAVHDKNTQKKEYRPKIIIAFNINDKPLAEKLSTELKVGKVIDRASAGHVLLQILAKEEVLKIINLINGHMRTPKIEALHRAIRWVNEKDNSSIPLLGIDSSPLESNSWLAGFTDADGCFGITVYDRKKNGVFLRTSVQTSFRIEVKQNYSREVTLEQGGSSFFRIMSEIAEFFTVNLYTRTRKTEDKVFYAFAAVAHNSRSHEILRNYFDNYPLYSSKYLAYKDWCLVQDLHRGSLSKDNLEKIKAIKNGFNTKRKVFDFSHLNSLQFK